MALVGAYNIQQYRHLNWLGDASGVFRLPLKLFALPGRITCGLQKARLGQRPRLQLQRSLSPRSGRRRIGYRHQLECPEQGRKIDHRIGGGFQDTPKILRD